MRLFRWRKPSPLDEPIEKLLTKMNRVDSDSKEYSLLVEHLERLVRLKSEEGKSRISPDTMAIVLGNLFGILVIVAYEQKHILASRGMGQLLRTKHS